MHKNHITQFTFAIFFGCTTERGPDLACEDKIAAIRSELGSIQKEMEATKSKTFLTPGTRVEVYVKTDTIICGLSFNYPLWLNVTAVSLNDSGLTFSKTSAVLHTVDFDGRDKSGQPTSFGGIYGLYKRVKRLSASLPCEGDSWIPLSKIETFTVIPSAMNTDATALE